MGRRSGRRDSDVTVARHLLSRNAHQALVGWLDDRLPVLGLGVPLAHDPEQFNRRYAHNPPVLVDLHRQLTDYASDLFGEPLKPSYAFLSLYNAGGRCPLHIDRPQCYRTIDYLVRQTNDPWPLRIGPMLSDDERDEAQAIVDPTPAQVASRWTEVLLEPNDAACYSGTHQWHYRPTASTGKADLAFFHFVPAAYDGPLD